MTSDDEDGPSAKLRIREDAIPEGGRAPTELVVDTVVVTLRNGRSVPGFFLETEGSIWYKIVSKEWFIPFLDIRPG